jgi:hypothetical protein
MLVFSIIAVDCTGQDSMVLATSCIPYPPTAQLPNCPPTAKESVPGSKDFLSPRNAAGECEASPGFRKAEIIEVSQDHHLRRPQPEPQNLNHKVDLSCPRTVVPGFREVQVEVYDQLRRPLTSPRGRQNF